MHAPKTDKIPAQCDALGGLLQREAFFLIALAGSNSRISDSAMNSTTRGDSCGSPRLPFLPRRGQQGVWKIRGAAVIIWAHRNLMGHLGDDS